jgi:exosome complex RNA-binding protein Rrp42 (RNase PH superfamily)
MISAAEALYFSDGIQQGIRADGRAYDSIRPLHIERGVVNTAYSSCRVRSKGCDIYVAIKSDIGRPNQTKPDEGIVNVSIEFGCAVLPRNQDFTGRQANIEADAFGELISSHISVLCLSTLDKKQFCIQPSRACWIVSIDVLVERIDGPLLDPISLGIRAALLDLELPVAVLPAESDIRDGDEKESPIPIVELTGELWKTSPQSSSGICVSVGIFCNNTVMMVDLDRVEENLAKSRGNILVSVSVNEKGDCSGIHKFGTGALDPHILREVLLSASNVGKRFVTLLTKLFG